MLISFLRLIKISAQNFWRNIWLSIATLTILVLALASVNILIVLNVLTNMAIKTVEDKIDISLYFKPEVSAEQIFAVKATIENFNEAKEVVYVSPDAALEEFKARHQDNALLTDSLGELVDNPLGAVLVIKAKDLNNYQLVLNKIQGEEFREFVNFVQETDFNDYEAIIKKLNNFARKVRLIGIGVISVFLLIAIMIIFNTIRVAIYTHKEEISIMRLVGATSWFISGPFLAESVFYGFFSWLITMSLIFPFLNFIRPHVTTLLGVSAIYGFDILDYFRGNFFSIFGFQLAIIIILSMVSSAVAIRRYLKV